MLDTLVASTYSALDRDPHALVAFRARHPDGLTWLVKNRVLRLSTSQVESLLVYPLSGKTIAQTMVAIAAVGCTFPYVNPDLADRAADSLLAGTSSEAVSNGDVFSVYDSLLWSLLDSYALALETAQIDIDMAIQQLYLGTADGEWLDVWGDYFALPRQEVEADATYRVRILVETLRPRVNKFAIEKAVYELTGNVIDLYEPWKDLFILSGSELSGSNFMQDGAFYTYNIVQPRTAVPMDWAASLQVIARNKPVGTLIAGPAFFPLPRNISMVLPPVHNSTRTDLRASHFESYDPTALDYLSLSNYQCIVNTKARLSPGGWFGKWTGTWHTVPNSFP